MQFIANAVKLYKDTILLVIKLSNKYTKVVEYNLISTATQLVNEVMLANSIRATTEETYQERRKHFKSAKHKTHLLCVELEVVLDLSIEHDTNNKVKNIENICQRLGEQMDEELKLLDGIMASDYKKYKSR